MIEYIASDLDGTLLRDGSQEVSKEMFDLIRRLKERGIHFIAASGRQYRSLQVLFAPVKDDISYVAENGSLCIHQNQIISTASMDNELTYRIVDAAKEYGDCHTLISTVRTGYTDSKSQQYVDRVRNVVHYNLEVVDDVREITEPIIKIAICDYNGSKERLLPFFKERFGKEIDVVTSGNIWLDFIAPGANKGLSLAGLLRHMGIDPKNGITFGDQYNDVEMLQLPSTSYAMTNAAQGIARYATGVTDSVEEVLRNLPELQ